MKVTPNPQREWIVILFLGLCSVAFSVWTSTSLIDQVVSGAFTPETTTNKENTKPLDEVIRAGAVLDRLAPLPLEESDGEG